MDQAVERMPLLPVPMLSTGRRAAGPRAKKIFPNADTRACGPWARLRSPGAVGEIGMAKAMGRGSVRGVPLQGARSIFRRS
jgi:hypothetical protein